MHLIAIDFESFYSNEYGLSKLTTEEYIRDPRFEAIMMGYKVGDEEPGYAIGAKNIQEVLDALDVENNAVLAHHSQFDGLIMSHHFHHTPRLWFDTLSMARALHGTEVGGSLGKLLAHYQVGVTKGTYVMDAKGKRLADFSPEELAHYARYCMDDVEGTYRIFQRMLPSMGKGELNQIDLLIRMFTEPELLLDEVQLRDYARTIQAEKATLLLSAGVSLDEVMSNEKFAEALRRLQVEPPMKRSPTTGKAAYAFAKTDVGLKDLEDHDNETVQALVAARLGNRTTINETRALRMAGMATRGKACMYYKYAGATQTMRVCLVGDTLVTILRGAVILDILLCDLDSRDMVWDGEQFVNHGGLVDQGERAVVTYGGITGTPDHRVFVEEQDEAVELHTAMQEGYHLKIANLPA